MKRATEESLNQRRNEVAQLRQVIERAKMLEAGRETPFWKALKQTLEVAAKKSGEAKNGVLDRKTQSVDADFADTKSYRAAELLAESVISDVENAGEYHDRWLRRIAVLEEEIATIEKDGHLTGRAS